MDNIRVIVSVSPKDQHYASAMSLAAQGRTVYFVVAEKSSEAAKRRIKRMKPAGTVIVDNVEHYVTSNMGEIADERKITAREMCLLLVKEYNRRIVIDNDTSLRVVEPK